MERKDVTVNLGTAEAVAGAGLGATPPTGDAEAGDGHLDASEAQEPATRSREWKLGDRLRWAGDFGVVVKVGRKWITVQWTQDGTGATWQKQHLREWLESHQFERVS